MDTLHCVCIVGAISLLFTSAFYISIMFVLMVSGSLMLNRFYFHYHYDK